MTCSIVFIEHVDEIDLLENFIKSDTLVISLIPSVFSELRKRNIGCKNTLDYFGIDGHRNVLEKSNEVVEELRPILKQIKTKNVQYAFEKTWIFWFRYRLLYLLSMLYIINQAVIKNKVDKLITISESSETLPIFKKNLLSEIVKRYGLINNINVQIIINTLNIKPKNNNSSLIKKLIIRFIFLFQLIIFKIKIKNKFFVLALEDTNNMPNFLNDIDQSNESFFPVYLKIQRASFKTRVKEMLRGESFSFISLPNDSQSNVLDNFQSKLDICTSKIKSCFISKSKVFKINGLDISPFLLDHIENNLNNKMHSLNGELNSLNSFLDIAKPAKVFAQHSLGIGYALGEISLEENIPALLISHGSHVPNSNPMAKLEWSIHSHTMINSHYPCVAIQSPWASKFLDMQANLISKKIKTGPLLFAQNHKIEFDHLKLKSKVFNQFSNKKIILHAGTPKSWSLFRPWIYETYDEYINNINNVIMAVDDIPGIHLAIRFRPQEFMSIEDFKISLVDSDCYGIYSEGSFQDYLMASDFLLSYSSTSIEEALHYKVPVIQYDPDGKYEHIPAQPLKYNGKKYISTIYSVMGQKDLKSGLQWLNENHHNNDNANLQWSEHVFNDNKKTNWLDKMDLTKS